MDRISKFFQDDNKTPMVQVISALAFGVLLSPWAQGIFFLVIFIVIYEIFFYLFTHGNPRYYNVFVRVSVMMASILGYIIGRTSMSMNILKCGVPWVNTESENSEESS